MRPSRQMVTITLVLAAATILLIVALSGAGVILAWLWGGFFMLCLLDLMNSTSRKNLTVTVDLAASGFTGEITPLVTEITTKNGTLPAIIELRLTHDDGLSSAQTSVLETQEQPTGRLEIPLTLRRRGDCVVSRLSMRFASRFGLFEILSNWPLSLTIKSLPNINPILTGAIQTQMLPLLDGARMMKLRGEGSEFHQLRDFVPGMDPRSIDWKRSARVRDLVARETRAERNHQIMLCLDTGHLMAERLGSLAKLDHAMNAALALAWAGGLGGDNVGFYSFNSRPQPLIPPRPGRAAFGRIQSACADLKSDSAETNHTLGLTFLNSKLKRRSLVVVFSDFVDSVTAELLVENLSVMTKQHLVLYIALRDPMVQSFARPKTLTMTTIAKGISAARILQERQAVLDRLSRLGVICLDADPSQLTAALISRYIEIKAKEMI